MASSRRSTAAATRLLLDVGTSSASTRSSTTAARGAFMMLQAGSRSRTAAPPSLPRTCTCSNTLQARSMSSTSASTSSPASESTDEHGHVNQADLIRDEILKASLPFIPEYGFTLSALNEGLSSLRSSSNTTTNNSSIKTFLSNEPSSLFLDHLFPPSPTPSPPPPPSSSSSTKKRRKHIIPSAIKAINQRNIFKSAEIPFPINGKEQVEYIINEELNGPRKDLFEAWLDHTLKEIQSEGDEKRKTVLELIRRRLECNIPVLNHLPLALSTLARLDIKQPSITTLRPYFSHVNDIAKQIKKISGSNISTPRLATIYSLSEFYQLSKTNPDILTILDYSKSLLKNTEKYDGLINESFGFLNYAFKSWRNIIHSRGL